MNCKIYLQYIWVQIEEYALGIKFFTGHLKLPIRSHKQDAAIH